jgi:hypothetical protein
VKALKPAQPPIPILVVFAPPALRRAPLERCGGRPLVQSTTPRKHFSHHYRLISIPQFFDGSTTRQTLLYLTLLYSA